jgi:hypothetical protein
MRSWRARRITVEELAGIRTEGALLEESAA